MKKYSSLALHNDFNINQKSEQEIHIHLIHPDQVEDSKYNHLLNRDEKQKSQAFVFNKDSMLYTAAHIFLRQTLSLYEHCTPTNWQFSYDHFGKPTISYPGSTNLTFNLSHTHSMIACAVGYQLNLGVDVERHRTLNNFKDMCRLVLCEKEQEHLFSLAPQAQQAMFFRYWTLKEACVKALGKGLTIPLHSIQYEPSSDGTWRCNFAASLKAKGKLYSLHHDLPQDGYSLSLAAEINQTNDLPAIRLFDWHHEKESYHCFNVLPN